MTRIDVVVANHGRVELFLDSFERLVGFSNLTDRIVILDSSADFQTERKKIEDWHSKQTFQQIKVLIVRRRNWNLNHGAQMDYIRAVFQGQIKCPEFSFFMQDHYLDPAKFVKGDSSPADFSFDLNEWVNYGRNNPNSVQFCTRNPIFGFYEKRKVAQSFLDRYLKQKNASSEFDKVSSSVEVYNEEYLTLVTLSISGGNFFVNPVLYKDAYLSDPKRFVRGVGSYSFCHVWEARICKFLFDQDTLFVDKNKGATLKKNLIRNNTSVNVWPIFLPAYFFFGRDIYRVRKISIKEFLKEVKAFLLYLPKYERSRKLELDEIT